MDDRPQGLKKVLRQIERKADKFVRAIVGPAFANRAKIIGSPKGGHGARDGRALFEAYARHLAGIDAMRDCTSCIAGLADIPEHGCIPLFRPRHHSGPNPNKELKSVSFRAWPPCNRRKAPAGFRLHQQARHFRPSASTGPLRSCRLAPLACGLLWVAGPPAMRLTHSGRRYRSKARTGPKSDTVSCMTLSHSFQPMTIGQSDSHCRSNETYREALSIRQVPACYRKSET